MVARHGHRLQRQKNTEEMRIVQSLAEYTRLYKKETLEYVRTLMR